MNWLAHLALAPATPHGWLGALAGDLVKGPLPAGMHPGLRHSIVLHRRIDALTAAHPACARSRGRLDPRHGHYRAVLIDVFYDHVLAREFDGLGGEGLATFVARVHAGLDLVRDAMPPPLAAVYARLRDEGWLLSYRDPEGIATALRRMRRRLRRDHPLEEALPELLADRAGFAADLRALWPELRAAADAARDASG